MLSWIWQGLRTGIVTTRYPKGPAVMPPAYRGRPLLDPDRCDPTVCRACADACLPRAITVDGGALRLDLARCITCAYCVDACPAGAFTMSNDIELAARARADLVTELGREGGDGRVAAARR